MWKLISTLFLGIVIAGSSIGDEPGEDIYQPAIFYNYGHGVLHMYGSIDETTPVLLKRMIDQKSRLGRTSIRKIVMINVPGAMDDDATQEAGRLVRKHNIDTHVPAYGDIASGGTDFFLAGVNRTMESGAVIGVHSWSEDNENGQEISGSKLDTGHVLHQQYLEYYRDMSIPDEFYWFTLGAAAPESMHNMSPGELEKYKVITSQVP